MPEVQEKGTGPAASEKSGTENQSAKPAKPAGELTPEQLDEWDNQPPVVNLGATPPPVESGTESGEEGGEGAEGEGTDEDPVVAARQKEVDRVKTRRETVLANIRKERTTTREAVKAEKSKDEHYEEGTEGAKAPEEAEGWDRVDKTIREHVGTVLVEAKALDAFYSHEDRAPFYEGDEGKLNREAVEEFVKATFKNPTIESYALAHTHFFGEFEKDALTRKAKSTERRKVLAADTAATGSGAGGTQAGAGPAPERRRILPRQVPPEKWY